MTGLDADATAQAASTPHARRPALLPPAAESHAASVLFPPASAAAEHATRRLGRRGRQSAAPAGEARQNEAMPVRRGWPCEVDGGRGRREGGGDEAESERALSPSRVFSRAILSASLSSRGPHVTLEACPSPNFGATPNSPETEGKPTNQPHRRDEIATTSRPPPSCSSAGWARGTGGRQP